MRAQRFNWSLIVASLLIPGSTTVVRSQDAEHMSQGAGPLPGAVRDATGGFRDINAAIAAGYVNTQICVSGPEEGAMGVHLVNPALFDGTLEVERPEALVYEPKPGGGLELVAVEYITPADAWLASHPLGVQPDVMGHLLHFAPGPNRYGPAAFYELHVWAWRNNPHGTFADWNPHVSCAAWDGPLF